MSRNVLNLNELDWEIDWALRTSPDLGCGPLREATEIWIRSVARRWLVNHFEWFYTIKDVLIQPGIGAVAVSLRPFIEDGPEAPVVIRTDLPGWFRRAPNREAVVLDLGESGANALREIIVAMACHVNGRAGMLPESRLRRISADAALAKGKVSLDAARRKSREDHIRRLSPTIRVFEDGYRVDLLTNWEALAFEGERMSHCVGDYAKDVADGTCEILSLRDQTGRPRVTMEVIGGKWISMISGRGNARPAARYATYIDILKSELGLVETRGGRWSARMRRRFDPAEPASWVNRDDAVDILVESARRRRSAETAELRRDISNAIGADAPEVLDWLWDRVIAPGAGISVEDDLMDVFGIHRRRTWMNVLEELWTDLYVHDTRATRALRRHLEDQAIAALYEVLETRPLDFVIPPTFLHATDVDWEPMRRARRNRLARSYSGMGRRAKRKMRDPRVPDRRKEVWRRNHLAIRTYLDGDEGVFF